jgi:glycosyltransferase involved in cell wall biosynthesis
MKTEISVLIPSYNEIESLPELLRQVEEVLSGITTAWEILVVDDGSTDGTDELVMKLRAAEGRIKYIRLRRNSGKAAALEAGFREVRGEYVFTMDADLQDDPLEIPRFLEKLAEGYDLISGWKKKRYDPLSKTIPSRLFNRVTSFFAGIRLHDFNCGFKAYRREVIEEVEIYGELHRYIPALAVARGFRVGEMVVKHHPRRHGVTKYGVGRFFKGPMDLLTVVFLSRFTRKPLHLFGFLGMLSMLLGGLVLGYLIWWKLTGNSLSNRPLLFFGVLAIIVGIQFISFGLLGEMITSGSSRKEYSIQQKELD